MPWGLIDSLYICGSSANEKEWIWKVFRKLKENGALKEIKFTVVNKTETRYALSKEGVAAFLGALKTDSPLKVLLEDDRLSIREDKKSEEVFRWARNADIQSFLYHARVDNIFTAFNNRGQNPFVFGFVKQFSLKSPTLAECTINAMQEHIISQNEREIIVPLCSQKLYLPNKCNPYARLVDDNGTAIRSSNNSTGVLLDFEHRDAYMLFKSPARKKIVWRPTAYNSFARKMSTHLKSWRFENVDKEGAIKAAIILCETNGELLEKVKLFEKFDEPFDRIYPVIMKRDGLTQIIEMLTAGESAFQKKKQDEIIRKLPGAVTFHSAAGWVLRYKGKLLLVGTVLDLRQLYDIYDQLTRGKPPYVACYASQTHIYHDILGLPAEYILTICEG